MIKSDSIVYTDEYLRNVFLRVKTIAMVGASANWLRPSHSAMRYLLGKGFKIIPINPNYSGEQILGQTTYSSLGEIDQPVEMIDIFRSSEAAKEIVIEALKLKSYLGLKLIWMQLGIKNEYAANLAKKNGIEVVMDRCPKIEYGRLFGELGWMGINTGIITSKRSKVS